MLSCCRAPAKRNRRTAATSPRRPLQRFPSILKTAPLEVEAAAGLWSSQQQQALAETPKSQEQGWDWIDVQESKTPSPRRSASASSSPGRPSRQSSTSFSGDGSDLDDTACSGRVVRRSTSKGDVTLFLPKSPKVVQQDAAPAGDLRRLMGNLSEMDMALASSDEDDDDRRRRRWGVSGSWGEHSDHNSSRSSGLDDTHHNGRAVVGSTSFADVGALDCGALARAPSSDVSSITCKGGLAAALSDDMDGSMHNSRSGGELALDDSMDSSKHNNRVCGELEAALDDSMDHSRHNNRACGEGELAAALKPQPDEGLDHSMHNSRSCGDMPQRGFELLTRRSSSVPTIGGTRPGKAVSGRIHFGEPLVRRVDCFAPASSKEKAATWYTRAEYRSIRDAAWFIESLDVVRGVGDDAPSAPATAFGESRRGLCDDDTTKKRLARIRAVRFAVASASRHGLPADVVARLAATPDAALQAVEHAREDRAAALTDDDDSARAAQAVVSGPPRVDRAAVMKLLQDHGGGVYGVAAMVRKDSFSRLEDAQVSKSPTQEAATAAARYRHALRLYSSTRARSAPDSNSWTSPRPGA